MVIDETGCIGTGKLVLSSQAWEHLLGCSPADLVTSNQDLLAYLEHRLLFLRVTLLFGWVAEEEISGTGRLFVKDVRM